MAAIDPSGTRTPGQDSAGRFAWQPRRAPAEAPHPGLDSTRHTS